MIPSHYVVMEAIPINPNGKIDRNRLPAPEEVDGESTEHTFVSPSNDLEQAVLEIWQGILGRDGIGIADNFFDLGGDSLLAVRLVSALRIELGVEMDMKAIFLHPTVEELTLAIEEQEFAAMTPSDSVSMDASDVDPSGEIDLE